MNIFGVPRGGDDEDMTFDAAAGTVPISGQGRPAVVLDDNELSRARGGPRCMTMPLHREVLA